MVRNSVKIKQIAWIGRLNPEAEVLFEIRGKELWAFCHPCNFLEGEYAEVQFNIIEEEISEIAFWEENVGHMRVVMNSVNDRLRCYCYGKLVQIHPVVVDCGDMVLSLGDWLNDENAIGRFVYFVIARLDISRV